MILRSEVLVEPAGGHGVLVLIGAALAFGIFQPIHVILFEMSEFWNCYWRLVRSCYLSKLQTVLTRAPRKCSRVVANTCREIDFDNFNINPGPFGYGREYSFSTEVCFPILPCAAVHYQSLFSPCRNHAQSGFDKTYTF